MLNHVLFCQLRTPSLSECSSPYEGWKGLFMAEVGYGVKATAEIEAVDDGSDDNGSNDGSDYEYPDTDGGLE